MAQNAAQPTNVKIQESKTDKLFLGFVYLILLLALFITAYPLVYILSASISDPSAVGSGAMWLLPKDITFEGYQNIFRNQDIWRGYFNTIVLTVVGTLVNLLVTIPAGYVLSRKEFMFKNVITQMMIVTMFISGGLIPSYILVNDLGLTNTIWALILPGATSVYNIIITRTFFESTIPDEMIEAAIVDGANDFQILLQIVLPVSKPIIAVMALFNGVGHWNQYFNALLYIDDRTKYPLQMILREILVLSDMSSNPSANMTEAQALYMEKQQSLGAIMKYGVMVVASLPLIIAYPFLQKYFVQGVMIGSIKG